MTNCSSKSYPPQAHFDIHASSEDQAVVIDAMKSFGKHNGFDIGYRDTLPREGRAVIQITLDRSDGIVVSADNFMQADTLQTFFYVEKPDADWRSVKEAWLKVVTEAMDGRGEIIEVPLDTPP